MEFVRVEPPGCELAVVRRPAAARHEGSIVFLHGLGGASSSFASGLEAPALAPFELLLLDLLGHGSSDKPPQFDYTPASHAAVLFQALGKLAPLPPLHLVGYSLGGAVAVELARFPLGGLKSLVLVEPSLEAARMQFAKEVSGIAESEFRLQYSSLLERFTGSGAELADRRWAETAAFASAIGFQRSARGLVMAAQRGELLEHFRTLSVPRTLVLTEETYNRSGWAKDAETHGVRVILVDSPSKSPMYDNPDALFKAVALAAAAGGP